jgi:hypothetical protein
MTLFDIESRILAAESGLEGKTWHNLRPLLRGLQRDLQAAKDAFSSPVLRDFDDLAWTSAAIMLAFFEVLCDIFESRFRYPSLKIGDSVLGW